MSNKNADHYFLRGGGEMGELIRAKDWSKTSLGDPADWPQSLRTMVAVMLDNPFGMYIAWGNDYTQLYNGAYRPILGATKHPQALGSSTKETFAEIWDNIIGSMFDDVMKGKAVGFPDLMLPLNRNGFVEECYFDFAYSPIRKDDGEVGGVLVTVIETTNKKNTEEALKESEARFRAIADDAPVFIFLAGENAEVEYLNKTWREYTGISINDYKGRAWAEITHIDDIEPATKIYMDGFNKRESCSFENRQKGIDGIYRTILWKATPRFSPNGQFIGMMGVGLDIHERKKSEEKLRESEQKVRALVENAPFPIAVYVGKEMIVELANQSIIDIWGKGNDVSGKSFKEVLPELDNQSVFEQIQKVLETGESFHTKNTPLDLIIDGKPYTYYFNYSFTPLYDINGNIYGVMNTGVDLTELNLANKRIEESDKRLRDTMKQAPVGITILRGPEYIVEMANDAYLQLVDKKESDFVGNPLFATLPEVEETSHPLLDNVLNTGIPYHGNELPVPINRYGKLGVFYFDFIYYPLRDEDGTISGVIAVATEVTEKVEARKKIEESKDVIRESKERLEFILESAKGGDWELDLITGKAITSLRHDQCFGATEPFADWSYEKFLTHVHPEDRENEDRKFKEAVSSGCDWSIDCRVVWNDGTVHWIQSSGRNYGFIDGKATRMLGMVREVTEQKEALNQIAESEQRFRLATETSGVGIWEWNVITNKIRWDAQMFRIYGVEPTADGFVEYSIWSNAVAPEDLSVQEKLLQDTVKNVGIGNRNFKIYRTNDGVLRFIEAIETVRTNAAGKPEWVVGTNLDVTEIVLARKTIEESQAQLQNVFRQAPAAIALLEGAAHTFGLANSRYQKMTSRSEEQLLGKTMQEVFPELEGTGTIEIFDNVYKTGQTFSMAEYPLMVDINNDGIMQQQYFNFTAEPMKAEGKVASIMVIIYNITEQVEVRKKVEDSEKRFQAAVKAVQGILWTNNARGEMEGEQPGWATLTGQTYDEYQGYGWTQVVHPDDAKPTVDAWNDAVKERKTFIFEHRLKTKNEEWRDFSIRAIPLFNADGTLLQWVGVHTDITDNKQAAKTLKANEEKLNIVIEASELGTWEIDLNTNDFIYSNRYLEIMGYPHNKEITVDDTEKLIHPDYLEAKDEAIKKSRETGVFYFAGKIVWVDNSIHWIESKARLFYDEQNHPLKIIGTTEDITEERNHQQELEESEERFRNVANSAPVLIWMADTDKLCYFFNKGWLNFTGRTVEQESGNGWAEGVHPDDLQKCLDIYFSSFDKRVPFYMEYRLKRHDGAYRWLSDSGVPRFTSDGVFEGYIGACLDIDEQKKAEEQFKILADQAPMWVWLTDKEVNILYTNPEVLKFFGIAHYTEFTGNLWEQKVHPEDIGMVYQSFREAASLQQSFSFDFRVLNASTQQYEWFYIKAVPRLESGEFTGFIGTGININEQRLILSQLEYRKALLEAHNEASIDGILLVDTKGRILSYNHRFVELWNMPQPIVDAKDDDAALIFALTQLVHPDQFIEKVKWLYEHPDEISIDELEFKDGKIIERHGYPVAAADGSYYAWSWMFRDITEKRKYERTLKESEEKFRLLADSMPQHIWTSDPEGNLNYYNQSVFDYSGLTIEEINKDGWIQIVHPDDREENIKQWINSVTIGKDFLFEHRFRRHDGEYRWQLSRAIPQRDENDKIQMWVGTSTDIQEQKTFTQELEEKVIARTAELTQKNGELENKTIQLEEAQQLAHIGSWEWDVVANKIEWSDELFRLFGLPPQEFKANYENYLKYIHPDDREYVNSIVQQALEDHQPYSLFHKTAGADGKVRILSATGKVFTDGIGNVIRMSGTAQDVTEQKKYEEELKISEERFYKIFDNNPVAMYISEIKTSKIKYANSRFYNAFGYSKEEVIGRSSQELNLMDPEESKRVVDLIFGYLLESRPLAEVQALSKEEREALLLKLQQSEKMKDFEILYTRKNGEKFPAIISFEVIRIGVDSYTVTSCQDITERKKAEAQLRSQNDQLEKMNKELQSFAYISSHDLQEPLRKIQTFATRILDKEENNLSDNGKDMFNRMQNAAKRMQTLIQDLLAYSRTNTSERKFETTDLNKIIEEVKEDLKEELKEKDATIETNGLGDADIIPLQFRQLMHNLISNSLKFSNPHSAPRIQIKSEIVNGIALGNQTLSLQNKYCHIKVSDNGIGFEQEYSEKIFEVFQRLHGKSEYPGTGIGLAIVKKIVENHNGIIIATGEINKGATFHIYIPST